MLLPYNYTKKPDKIHKRNYNYHEYHLRRQAQGASQGLTTEYVPS